MPIHDWTRVKAGIFHDFHHEWCSTLKRALNSGILPPDYYALVEQDTSGPEPDVVTLERSASPGPAPAGNGATGKAPGGRGGISVAVAPPKARFNNRTDLLARGRRPKRITIRHVSGDDVVAVIEIVSPGNKSSVNALQASVRKSIAFFRAGVHLLVLDLFPPSKRDPQGIHSAVWSEITEDDFKLPADKRLTLASYAVGDELCAYVEPVAVGDPLPVMPLFIEPEMYVNLPLEPTYSAAFEAVPQRWRAELEPPAPRQVP